MKIYQTISAIATIVLLVASCTKVESEHSVKAGVLTATVENTKTYLVSNQGETHFDVFWDNGDKISTLQNSNQGCYVTACQTGSSSAEFTYESGSPISGGSFDAYYPSEIVQNGELVWPEHQNYREYAGGPMVSTGCEADAQGNATLRFKHLGGVIRFKLNTTVDFSVKAAMVTANEALSGSFTIDEGKAKITATSGIIAMDFDENVTVSSSTTGIFCFAVPAGTYSGLAITFLGTDGRMFTAKLRQDNKLTVERGVVTKIAASGVTPSTEQGSNCYIFYQGNAPIIIDLMGEYHSDTWIPLALGGAASAEVVWESNCTKSTTISDHEIISSAEYSNGKLKVTPTGSAGNAVVAVKDHKGKIIWSYHIWVPATIVSEITYNGHTFMDRNLGAKIMTNKNVSTTSGKEDSKFGGALYQKGRKDPFPGFYILQVNYSYQLWSYLRENTVTSLSNLVQNNYNDYVKNYIEKNTIPTIDETIQNVMTIYVKECSDLKWEKEDGSKTINDPCPYGYRMPKANEIGLLPAGAMAGGKVFYKDDFISTYDFGYKAYGEPINISISAGSDQAVAFWDAEGNAQARFGSTSNAANKYHDNIFTASIRCIKETSN